MSGANQLETTVLDLKCKFFDWHMQKYNERAILHAQTKPENHKYVDRWLAYYAGACDIHAELEDFHSNTSRLAIDGQIYFGKEGTHAMAQSGMLFMQLAKAFEVIGRIGQLTVSTGSEESGRENEENYRKGELEVRYIADTIFLALTGESVKETKEWEQLRKL